MVQRSPPLAESIGGGAAASPAQLDSTVTWNGQTFTIGSTGTPDVVANSSVPLPSGPFTTLYVLATGVKGNQPSQTFTVTYTDGTTSTYTQSVSDWFTPQSYSGEAIAKTMSYRNKYDGTTDNRTFNVYGYSFGLAAGKTAQTFTLPTNKNVVLIATKL